MAELFGQSVVARYKSYGDAEEAVRRLEWVGVPLRHISILGRDCPLREDVQGYYSPSDLVSEGLDQGAWVGGLFGMLTGFGLFFLPVAGPIVALGPLAGLIAGAVGGAGIGALVRALMALGMPKEESLNTRARIPAGAAGLAGYQHT